MTIYNRRTDPKVLAGKVQRKNNASVSSGYRRDTSLPAIERRNPGKGFRHLVTRRELERFLGLLPEWPTLSNGLDAVILDTGSEDRDGWHHPGVVAVCAWERDLWRVVLPSYYQEHAGLLATLGVTVGEREGCWDLLFDFAQARAFQLLHVLLHELGHHHDRMTTKSRRQASRGDGYAEHYASKHATTIYQRYVAEFGPV